MWMQSYVYAFLIYKTFVYITYQRESVKVKYLLKIRKIKENKIMKKENKLNLLIKFFVYKIFFELIAFVFSQQRCNVNYKNYIA